MSHPGEEVLGKDSRSSQPTTIPYLTQQRGSCARVVVGNADSCTVGLQ